MGFAQPYYLVGGAQFFGYDPGDNLCTSCTHENLGVITPNATGGAGFGPDGNLYILTSDYQSPASQQNNIYHVDLNTGLGTLVMDGPNDFIKMNGLAAAGGGIFYTIARLNFNNDSIYRWDANTGTVTSIGGTGYNSWGEMWYADGELYYMSYELGDPERKMIRVDLLNPANSEVVMTFLTSYGIFGLTATPIKDLFIGTDIYTNNDDMIVTVNIIDGSITYLCELSGLSGFHTNTSPYEHNLDPLTNVYIDLDCNDSSGAIEADYNGEPFDCLNEEGVAINDIDVWIYIDAPITEMRIELTNPIDIPDEKLIMSGAPPGIGVTGAGTTMITLTNTGNAKASDFNNALNLIKYLNSSLYPTAAQRIIEVQFTTSAGTESNIASAFIEVIELPHIVVDLGPDIEICDGEFATLDASATGEEYEWSNGANTPTTLVNTSGIYSVTVSDGVNCPNVDVIEVGVLPIISISLEGDTAICEDGAATLTIITDTPYPLTIDVDASPGSPFTFPDVTGNFDFTDVPFTVTEYTITNVTSTLPACINVIDNFQVIEILPHYNDSANVLICGNDSVLLGNQWISEAGFYPVAFNSIHGCDSNVLFIVNTLTGDSLFFQTSTCNYAEAGVFLSYLTNPVGCDTVVQSTINYLASDTIIINTLSCNSSNAGVFIDSLINHAGCDSLIITNINLIAPEDTTAISSSTCDSTAIGVFQQTLTNKEGCDSLIITTISLAPTDTSYTYGISCDPAGIGVFQTLYSNQSGCDSLVISIINAGITDTTYINTTSCDSASLGIFEKHFTTATGCDSIVFTNVSFSADDSTFINLVSCDPGEVGVIVENLINRFGCDSIVTNTIALAPSHSIEFSGTSCNPADTGIFNQNFLNQFGCDSIVTTTIALLPSHSTFINSTTCDQEESGVFNTLYSNQFGCDSIVIHNVAFIPPDTTRLFYKSCFENEIGAVETLWINEYGCDSLVMVVTELHQLPQVAVAATSDFNGYPISCFDAGDGSIVAVPSGISPWNFVWSDGSSDSIVSGLNAGYYEVTVTDGNGCIATNNIYLEEPLPLILNLVVNEPDCFETQEGVITVEPSGGVTPFRYSIDGVNFQSSNIFTSLAEGTYQITTLDANDCEKKEIVWINVPLKVNVDLGMDQIIALGDTSLIEAIVSVPYDSLSSINWSGLDNNNCPECLIQPVAPIITTTYSITVSSVDGCTDKDAVTLFVEIDDDIYVPNIFSPNGDNINDQLVIKTDSSIKEISSFTIYDRWGNMVFEARHFYPDDLMHSWDGRMKGRDLNSGVFAYILIAEMAAGGQAIRYGDVTLLR